MEFSMSWYFKGPRMVITIPILLLVGLNVVYHTVMAFLMQIDLLIGNFLVWFLFGEFVAGFAGFLAVTLSWAPLALLPFLWDSRRIWGIGKIAIFVVGLPLATGLAGLVSALSLGLIDFFAPLRATLWWAQLWGVTD